MVVPVQCSKHSSGNGMLIINDTPGSLLLPPLTIVVQSHLEHKGRHPLTTGVLHITGEHVTAAREKRAYLKQEEKFLLLPAVCLNSLLTRVNTVPGSKG